MSSRLVLDHGPILRLALAQAGGGLRVLPHQRRQQHQRDGDGRGKTPAAPDDLGGGAGDKRPAAGLGRQQGHERNRQQVQAQPAGSEANGRPQQQRQRREHQPLVMQARGLPAERRQQRHDQAAVSAMSSTTCRGGARRIAASPPVARWMIAVATADQADGAAASIAREFAAGFRKNRSIGPPSGTRRARGYVAVEPKQPGDGPI